MGKSKTTIKLQENKLQNLVEELSDFVHFVTPIMGECTQIDAMPQANDGGHTEFGRDWYTSYVYPGKGTLGYSIGYL